MSRPRIAISCRVYPDVLARLEARCDVTANQGSDPWTPEQLRANVRDAHALLAFMPDCVDETLLDACPDLGIVACALKGYDNFDVEACTSRGIWVTAVPDLLTAPTAELAIGLLIALARNVDPGDRFVRGPDFRGWRPALYGAGLDGSTVGIVGAGKVGLAVAERLQGFGCARILAADPAAIDGAIRERLGLEQVGLGELLEASDFVVCAAPLTPGSRHLLDARALEGVRPDCRLVNVGRGSVIDERAVAEALDQGRLGGYAADVFEFEDWARSDRPSTIPEALIDDCDRTVFTPHLGSAVAEVRLRIEHHAAASILQYLDGRVPDGAINEPESPRPAPGA